MKQIWLAAKYHFPSTYSCRIPMSSMAHARVMPAPGPATIRLALLRTGIELFGFGKTRQAIFPSLRTIELRIQPPERVAISQHRVRGYKWGKASKKRQEVIQESVLLREMAHASEPLTVYLRIPASEEKTYCSLLQTIGYWGKTDSLTCCVSLSHKEPAIRECAMPLASLHLHTPLQPFFSCLVSEFRHASLRWEDVVPDVITTTTRALTLDVYVWPLVLQQQDGGGKLFVRHPLSDIKERG